MAYNGDSNKAHQRNFFRPTTIKPEKKTKAKTHLPEHQPNFFSHSTELQMINTILMLNVTALIT